MSDDVYSLPQTDSSLRAFKSNISSGKTSFVIVTKYGMCVMNGVYGQSSGASVGQSQSGKQQGRRGQGSTFQGPANDDLLENPNRAEQV